MKLKHNKKRNTAFLYEAIIREVTKSIMQKDDTKKQKLVFFLKEHFNVKTTLGKDLRLYKILCESYSLLPHSAEKLIHEIRKENSKIDKKELFREQSTLIKKINKAFSKSVFSNFVPNYKSLATIYQIFNEETPLQKRVILEESLLKRMIIKEEKKQEMKPINNLVYETFIKKFNKKYSLSLLEEQKNLLNKYLYSFVDNGVELKLYLNEEIGRLKKYVRESLKFEEIKSDPQMAENTKEVLSMLEGFKDIKINQSVVSKVLKIQNLVKEILD